MDHSIARVGKYKGSVEDFIDLVKAYSSEFEVTKSEDPTATVLSRVSIENEEEYYEHASYNSLLKSIAFSVIGPTRNTVYKRMNHLRHNIGLETTIAPKCFTEELKKQCEAIKKKLRARQARLN